MAIITLMFRYRIKTTVSSLFVLLELDQFNDNMKICFTNFLLLLFLNLSIKQSKKSIISFILILNCLQSHASLRCYAGFENQTESKERERWKRATNKKSAFFSLRSNGQRPLLWFVPPSLSKKQKQKQTTFAGSDVGAYSLLLLRRISKTC